MNYSIDTSALSESAAVLSPDASLAKLIASDLSTSLLNEDPDRNRLGTRDGADDGVDCDGCVSAESPL